MSNTADRVALTHPEHPDVVIYRLANQLPSLKRSGWREANSSSTRVVEEHQPPLEGANPSEEES